MSGLIACAILFGGLASYLGLTFWARERAWNGMARRHDLERAIPADNLFGRMYEEQHLHGLCNGRDVSIRTERRSTGHGSRRSSSVYTLLHIGGGGLFSSGLRIQREGLRDKVAKLFGRNDALAGSAKLDRLARIENLTPEDAQLLGDEGVQLALIQLLRAFPRSRIGDGFILVEQYGHVARLGLLERMWGAAAAVAMAMDSARRMRHPEAHRQGPLRSAHPV